MSSVSEIESLRSQVAELARELAERDQLLREQRHQGDGELQSLREQSTQLRTIVTGTAEETGDDFFAVLVTTLTSVLGVQYAVIGKVLQDSGTRKIRTVAVAAGGTLVDNFEYDLLDTPCETALATSFACFDQDVQTSFPSFTRLRQLNVEGYCGVSISAKNGAVIGLLVVMDIKPLVDNDWLRSLLTMFAARAAAELERARAEDERSQALADLHNIMETIPDVLFTLDLQGHLVRWNQTLERVTGYSAEELLHKHALEFVPPAEHEPTASAIQRAFQEGYAELVGHLLTKNGRTIPYYWTGAVLKNEKTVVIGITGVGRDISDRTRSEERLQELNLALSQAMPGIARLDADGHYLEVNGPYASMLGYTPTELLGRSWEPTVHPADLHLAYPAFEEMLQSGKGEFEARGIKKDGSVFWKQVLMVKGVLKLTGPVGHHCFMRDITERKQAEWALTESRQLLHSIMEGLPDAVFAKDLSGNYLVCNEATATLIGKTKTDVQGHNDRSIFPPDVAQTLMETDHQIMTNGSIVTYEETIVPEDGIPRTFLTTKGPLLDRQGQTTGLFGIARDLTERKKMEAALRASEERLRLAMDIAELATWDWDISTNNVVWSENCERVKRLPPGTFDGTFETYQRLVHPDDLPTLFADINRALAGPDPYHTVHRIVPPGGNVQWIEGNGIVYRNENGQPIRMVGTVHNTTARRRAEEAVRISEERFALAVEGSTDVLWDAHRIPGEPWHAPETPIWWSPRARQLLGLEDGESFNTLMQWTARLHPDDTNHVFARLTAHIEQRVPYDVEYRLRTNHGDYRWVRGRGQAIWNEQGEICRMSGSCQDITDRKQAEEALRVSEERFTTAFNEAAIGMALVAPDGHWLEVNQALCQILGYSKEELQGKIFHTLTHPDDLQQSLLLQQRLLSGELRTHQIEERYLHKEGHTVWAILNVSSVRNHEGHVLYHIAQVQDITERKRAEKILEVENQVLALMASSRSLSETLTFLCACCESLGHGMLASVLLLDQECQRLRHSASPSLPESYSRAIDGVVIGPDVGSCGTAAYLGRQVIVADIATDPLWEKYREFALNHDLRACWSNPIISDEGQVLGTFAIYYRTPRAPVPADLHLINRMTNLTRFAIERTRGELALRMSEERLRQALLASNTGLWDWNTETGEVSFSKEWKSQLGFSETELPDTFESWEARLHPDDRARAVAYAQQYRDNPVGAFRQDFRLLHKDGTYRWIDSHASFITEPDGRRVRLLGSHTDITERKQTEEDLKLFRTLLDQVTDSIEVIDPSSGRFLDGNRQSYESIGYTRSELSALTVPDIDPLVTKPVFQEYMQRLREAEGPMRIESLHLRKDGTTFPVEVMAQILRNEREYLVAVVRDITTRKQLEAVQIRQYEALQAIFNMTVALSRASSLEEIYEQGINGVQGALKVDRASILLFDDDGVMKFKASRGLSKEYIQAVEGHSPWSREAVNPPPIAMQDIEEEPSVEAYRGIFRAEHIRALGFIPLWSSDGLLGKFMLYYDSPHHFTEEEIQVAQTIAGHIAFMIQRKRAEEALRVSEERYARATAIGNVGVWQLDVASGTYHGDANLKALFGYGPGELSTDPFAWLGLVHPDDQPIALKTWEQVVSGVTDEYHYEIRMIRKDGSIIWTHVRGHANRNETGTVVQLIGATVDITERKRAEEVLRLTQFSVDRAVDAVFWVAPDARILNVNEAACRLLEYTREELMGMTVHEIDPNFPADVWAAHWEELKQKGSMTIESKHWSRTGRVLETEVTVNYLQYEGREYNCAIMRDISERKRAQTALHASEERYRRLYDDTPTMYFKLATDATVRSVNRYGAEQLGYRVEELIGHSILNMFHEEDKETVATSLSECLATPETTKQWEFRMVRKDGTTIWVRETARVGQAFTGEPAVLVTCEDITGRKRAEEALRLAKFSMERAADAVYWIDPQARILDVNEAASLMLGYSKDEFCAMTVHDLNPAFQAAMWPEFWADTKRRGTMVMETAHQAKDGRLIPIEVSINYLAYEGQEYHCAFVRDITERKRTEHEVSERTQQVLTMQAALLRLTRLNEPGQTFAGMILSLATIVAETLMVERVSIWQFSEDQTELICEGLYERSTSVISSGFSLSMSRYPRYMSALQDSLVVAVSDARIDPRTSEFANDYLLPMGIASMLDVPIRRQGKLVGVLCIEQVGSSRDWSHEAQNFGASVGEILVGILEATERKRAEEALQKSHAFLRQVIDTDPNFIFAKDREGRFTLVNKAIADAYGTTVDNLIGKTDADFNLSQDEVENFRLIDLEVMDTLQERFVPEERITDANGNVRWLQTVKRPIVNEQDQAVLVLGAATDITERRRMEEALRQRERDLRAAVEERERISEDLHDGILQSIYAIGLGLEACTPLLSDLPNKSATKLNMALRRTIGQLNTVLEEVRNFIAGLESQILNGQEFDMVLQTMVHTLAAPYSIPCKIAIDQAAAQALSTEQAYHVMNIAREAMSNGLRHSKATRITVSLTQLSRSVRLSIIDNGVGFDPDSKRDRGHGLANMAARAQKLRGKFALQSKPKHGTKVLVDIPGRFADADT